jgi:hypothetical protein
VKCTVLVQTWWCVEATVEVEAGTLRAVREKALVAGHDAHRGKVGSVTKNKTTIVRTEPR